MRSLVKSLLALVISGASFHTAHAAHPTEVYSPVDRMFVPAGFDDNDNVQVVLFGFFPNSCYQTGHTRFQVNEEAKTITIWATSYRYDQMHRLCAAARVPFTQTVALGILKKGVYQVQLGSSPNMDDQLHIGRHTTENADEYFYAPVDSVIFSQTDEKSDENPLPIKQVTLLGTYPYLYVGCEKIVDVKFQQEKDDIWVVRPIVDIVTGEECSARRSAQFRIDLPLPVTMKNESLVHVRVANGNAINKVYLQE